MRELVFKNNKISYDVQLRTSIPGINYPMKLDTGSPITVIPFSILPDLLGKSLMVLIDKVHDFTEHYDTLCFKSYNSDKSDKGIRFVPYLIDDVRIEDVVFPYFLFWVNIDGFELGGNFSSLLFGMDYIIQAKRVLMRRTIFI